jgi:hypothetical protein
VKHAALRNRLAALEAVLCLKPLKVAVTGGMPPPADEPEALPPGGRELREQAAAFARRSRQGPEKPADAPASASDAPNSAASVGAPAPRIDQSIGPAPRRAPYRSRRHPA